VALPKCPFHSATPDQIHNALEISVGRYVPSYFWPPFGRYNLIMLLMAQSANETSNWVVDHYPAWNPGGITKPAQCQDRVGNQFAKFDTLEIGIDAFVDLVYLHFRPAWDSALGGGSISDYVTGLDHDDLHGWPYYNGAKKDYITRIQQLSDMYRKIYPPPQPRQQIFRSPPLVVPHVVQWLQDPGGNLVSYTPTERKSEQSAEHVTGPPVTGSPSGVTRPGGPGSMPGQGGNATGQGGIVCPPSGLVYTTEGLFRCSRGETLGNLVPAAPGPFSPAADWQSWYDILPPWAQELISNDASGSGFGVAVYCQNNPVICGAIVSYHGTFGGRTGTGYGAANDPQLCPPGLPGCGPLAGPPTYDEDIKTTDPDGTVHERKFQGSYYRYVESDTVNGQGTWTQKGYRGSKPSGPVVNGVREGWDFPPDCNLFDPDTWKYCRIPCNLWDITCWIRLAEKRTGTTPTGTPGPGDSGPGGKGAVDKAQDFAAHLVSGASMGDYLPVRLGHVGLGPCDPGGGTIGDCPPFFQDAVSPALPRASVLYRKPPSADISKALESCGCGTAPGADPGTPKPMNGGCQLSARYMDSPRAAHLALGAGAPTRPRRQGLVYVDAPVVSGAVPAYQPHMHARPREGPSGAPPQMSPIQARARPREGPSGAPPQISPVTSTRSYFPR